MTDRKKETETHQDDETHESLKMKRERDERFETDEAKMKADIDIMNRETPRHVTYQQSYWKAPSRKPGKFFSCYSKDVILEFVESLLTELIVVWLVWAILWSFLGEKAMIGSYVFGIAILTSMSYFIKAVVTAFTNLIPGHFMIGLGILAKYTFLPELEDFNDFFPEEIGYVMRLAYVVFLLRAGLGTNLIDVKHNTPVIGKLVSVHLVARSSYICVVTKFALDIPWDWATLAGTILEPSSAISVFTVMSRLREQGYEPYNRIHSVVIFPTIIDGLLSLCFCTTSIIQACTTRTLWGAYLVHVPGQILIGSVLGIATGFIGIYIPSNNNAHSDIYRCLYFVTSSVFFLSFFTMDYRGASFLAAYMSPLVAITGWKHLNYYDSVLNMRNVTTLLWSYTQPFLFSMIGAEINIQYLGERKRLIFIGVHLTSLVLNVCASALATWKTDYSWKERHIIWLSQIPKGAIEIAVGVWALRAVKADFPNDKIQEDRAQLIIDCCVLAFFISGPLGTVLLDVFARKLLKQEDLTQTFEFEDQFDESEDRTVSLPSEEGKKKEVTPSQQIV